jgi:DNA repair protein RadC
MIFSNFFIGGNSSEFMSASGENPNAGHRERLRMRFVNGKLSGFSDYEVIELILTYAIPRKDVKPLAKQLIRHFGSFAAVFDASVTELQQVNGIGERAALLLTLFSVYLLSIIF